MASVDRFSPLLLTGLPRERGRIHGEAFRDLIKDLYFVWEIEISKAVGMDLHSYLDRFVQDTNYIPMIDHWSPDLLEEARGIAEGANVSFEYIFCFQNMDEHWHHLEHLQAQQKGTKCSCFGSTNQASPPTLIGENMDLPKWLDGFQILLHIKYPDSDLEVMVSSLPGFLGLFGLNNHGIALCVNTLFQLNSASEGVPVTFISRSILQSTKFQDAVTFLRQVPHASGQNYLLGGPNDLIDFECSQKKVAIYRPNDGSNLFYHTNHPLVNDDLEKGPLDGDTSDIDKGYTLSRFESLERSLKDNAPLTVSRMKSILCSQHDHICRLIDNPSLHFTFSSAIFELGDCPVMHLSFGPPTVMPYREFRFV